MENIVIASDSFKGSANSSLVAACIEKGILNVCSEVNISKFAIADGGEGTVEAIIETTEGTYHDQWVSNPYGEMVKARYGMIDTHIAVIEMAEASGLQFKDESSDPGIASSYGTGELILAALDRGADQIYLGLGGSATVDGGAGMLQAIGVKLLDKEGECIGRGIEELSRLEKIDASSIDPRIRMCDLSILSDVTNPLTGANGSIAVFGSQKGVVGDDINYYNEILERFAEKVDGGGHVKNLAGAGAAGGLGFALLAFCEAKIDSGIEQVIRLINLEEEIKQANLVITGEGKMDGQSIQGKAPVGIARLAKKYHVPVVAVVGGRENKLAPIYDCGIDLVIDIVIRPMLLEEAIADVETLLIEAGESVYRAYKLGR